MKKTIILLATVLISTVALAQKSVKVAAHFNKGDYVIYEFETKAKNTDLGMDMFQKGEVKYEVTDVRKDGYTIICNTLKCDNVGGEQDNPLNDMGDLIAKSLVGKKIIYKTDSDGKIIKIDNFEELTKEIGNTVDEFINKIFEGSDENMPIDKNEFKKSILNDLSEEKLIESINSSSANHFKLYGKTLATGTMEDEVSSNDIKYKTTYVVTPLSDGSYSIKSSSVGNMSEDDMVNMVIAQVEKMMPDQVNMIKENIGMLKETGLLKVESSQQCTYEFLKNGWLKSGEKEFKINIMSNNSEGNVKWKIKESNIK